MDMKYGLALGSNAGARKLQMRAAREIILRELAGHNSSALIAGLYETEPVDCNPGTRSFYNSCMEIESALPPQELLQRLQDIEHRLGRPAHHPRNAPRSIDIDILYADNVTINTSELTIPHPGIASRRFVLEPLAEIRPHLTLPGHADTVASLLKSLNSSEPPLHLKSKNW
jgi:2-amino-4-hydroxy-6-hydroxymethyldihydropteridine diphosphokinase